MYANVSSSRAERSARRNQGRLTMQVQERNEVRSLTAEEIDTVAGGSALAELGKIVLGWALGKVMDSGSYTPPQKAAENYVNWLNSLSKGR